MPQLTFDQVARLALGAGFREDDGSAATAVAIAKAESNFQSDVIGDMQYGGSVGLWQINLPASPQFTADQLKDPKFNAKAAYAISRGGTNFNPWCTYKPTACNGAGNNAYAAFLPEARAAVARASKLNPVQWVKDHPVITVGLIAAATASAVYYFRPDLFKQIPVVGRLAAEENPVKRLPGRRRKSSSKAPGAGGGRVQTLLFPRASFTPESAQSWARKHGFKSGTPEVTDQYVRIRQLPPGGRMRTIQFQNTLIRAVVRFG